MSFIFKPNKLWLLLVLAGCGSPILDHQTSRKPKQSTGSKSALNIDSTSLSNNVENLACDHKIESTPLCFSLQFLERPIYKASEKSFQAEFRIWDSRDPKKIVEISELPLAHHRCEIECCDPPKIKVKSQGAQKYLLSNIEFHIAAWFDFLIELQTEEFGLRRAQIAVEVFDD